MLKGSYVALVTPFKNGEIDYIALENLIQFHLDNHTDGILLCGTTGEAPALAGDEKESLIRFAMKKIAKKIPVMIGTGSNNLHHTISMTLKAQKLGAEFALVITPYYNKPTQKGLYEYFKEVALKCSEMPIVIYNVPGRTGVNISAETTIKLANDFENIVGIKEASGNLDQITEIVKNTSDDFSVMSGEDSLNLPIMACGANGVISVTANVLPKEVHDLIYLASNGNFNSALSFHQYLYKLNKAMFIETNPIPVKETLALMNKINREFRPPMCEMTESNYKKLQNVLKEYKLI